MSNNDINKDLSSRLQEGMKLAEKRMLEAKAAQGQDIVVSKPNGEIQRISAQKVLDANKEYYENIGEATNNDASTSEDSIESDETTKSAKA